MSELNVKGTTERLLRWLLWPFAVTYDLITRFRNWLYDRQIKKSYQTSSLPIICVGNLNTGGTGKSPMVRWVAEKLLAAGQEVVVLSRGYGRTTRGYLEVELTHSHRMVGDEPLMHKLYFGERLRVVVCEDRAQAVQTIEKEYPSHVVLLDDGYQHRGILPGFSIVLSASYRPFWRDWLLPMGSLREGAYALKRANALVITKIMDNGNLVDKARQQWSKWHGANNKGEMPVWGSSVQYKQWVTANKQVLDAVPEGRYMLVTGIADDRAFKKYVAGEWTRGADAELRLRDHGEFEPKHLNMMKEWVGAPGQWIVTTEKDWARMSHDLMEERWKEKILVVGVEVKVEESTSNSLEKLLLDYVSSHQRSSSVSEGIGH